MSHCTIARAIGLQAGLILLATQCTPARAPLALGNPGCASGVRDGFKDTSSYPKIAACSGSWTVPGLAAAPASAAPAPGSAAALCSTGWHICATASEVADRTAGKGCADSVSSPTDQLFFATLQSGSGYALCDGKGLNDVFGCGSIGAQPAPNCAPLNHFSHNNCSALPAPWACSGSTIELTTVTKSAADHGGVLCCQ